MTYNEFKSIAEYANRQSGSETLIAGNYTLNNGMIYNPRVNGGRGVLTNPEDTFKKMWVQARKNGSFTVNGKQYFV